MNESANMRVGILGGTFNPIHLGHLILAQTALEIHELERVILIPCNRPPHKRAASAVAAEHRLAMVRAAVECDPRFEVSDVEVRRGGISYAVDTVAELRTQWPGAELFFIIGTDTLRELHLWRDIYSVLALCTFLPFARPGVEVETIVPEKLQLDHPWPERLVSRISVGRSIEISSSDIRHRVAEGMSIRYLVPDAVEMYIAEHGLYTV